MLGGSSRETREKIRFFRNTLHATLETRVLRDCNGTGAALKSVDRSNTARASICHPYWFSARWHERSALSACAKNTHSVSGGGNSLLQCVTNVPLNTNKREIRP